MRLALSTAKKQDEQRFDAIENIPSGDGKPNGNVQTNGKEKANDLTKPDDKGNKPNGVVNGVAATTNGTTKDDNHAQSKEPTKGDDSGAVKPGDGKVVMKDEKEAIIGKTEGAKNEAKERM